MLRRQSYSLNEMVDRQVSKRKKVRSILTALFIYLGTPRNKGIGQAGPTDDGSNGANGDTVDGDFTKVDPDK